MTTGRESFRPYVGPRPFEQKERQLFFGRDREASDLIALVIGNPAVVLHAQSGAGKTSLLNAAVIPMLAEKGFSVLPVARVSGMLPESVDVKDIRNIYVFNTLLSWSGHGNAQPVDELTTTTLSGFLHSQAPQASDDSLEEDSQVRVLVFDQFEEIFTTHPERWAEHGEFFKQLGEVLADPFNRVILALREDFIAQLDNYVELIPDRLRARFRMLRLGEAQSLDAITQPLIQTDCSFDTGVAEALVDELMQIRVESDSGETIKALGDSVEPVQLQVVCDGLWKKLPKTVTKISHVHRDKYANVDEALSNFYLEAIKDCAENTEIPLLYFREWCGSYLVTSTGTRGIVHRGPESTAGLPNAVVECLESKHLIRSERRAGARWYELTHDRFIDAIQQSNTDFNEQRDKAYPLLQQAQKMAQKEQFSSALESCQAALKIGLETGDPSIEEWAYNLQASIYREQGDNFKALEIYNQALLLAQQFDTEDNYRLLLLEYGALLRDTGVLEAALNVFKRIVEANPEDLVAYSEAAWTLLLDGRWEAAIEYYNKAIELTPENAKLLDALGVCYQVGGELERAEQYFLDALDKDPTTVSAHSNLGILYASLGRSEEAESHFQKALTMDPRNADAMKGLAHQYSALGREQEAISAYERAVKIQPYDFESLEGLAYSYRGTARYEEAIAIFQRIIDIFPDEPHPHIGLGGVFRRQGDIKQAIAHYKQALSKEQDNPLARASLAFCYKKLGDERRFAKEVKLALKTADEAWLDETDDYNQACFYALCGREEPALSHLKKALEDEQISPVTARADIDFELIKDKSRFRELVEAPTIQ